MRQTLVILCCGLIAMAANTSSAGEWEWVKTDSLPAELFSEGSTITSGTLMPIATNRALLAALRVGSFTTKSYIFHNGTWTRTQDMPHMRSRSAAVTLSDGRVLFIGGRVPTGEEYETVRIASTVFFDPATNTWASGPDMNVPREMPATIRLADGRVLVVEGVDNDVEIKAETYNPITNQWTPVDNPPGGTRLAGELVLLPDGRALLAGGTANHDYDPVLSSALFDPNSNKWTTAGDTDVLRVEPALRVVGGKALLFGGWGGAIPLTSGSWFTDEVLAFDSTTDSWSPHSHSLSVARGTSNREVAQLSDGSLLLGGPVDSSFGSSFSADDRFDRIVSDDVSIAATAPLSEKVLLVGVVPLSENRALALGTKGQTHRYQPLSPSLTRSIYMLNHSTFVWSIDPAIGDLEDNGIHSVFRNLDAGTNYTLSPSPISVD